MLNSASTRQRASRKRSKVSFGKKRKEKIECRETALLPPLLKNSTGEPPFFCKRHLLLAFLSSPWLKANFEGFQTTKSARNIKTIPGPPSQSTSSLNPPTSSPVLPSSPLSSSLLPSPPPLSSSPDLWQKIQKSHHAKVEAIAVAANATKALASAANATLHRKIVRFWVGGGFKWKRWPLLLLFFF